MMSNQWMRKGLRVFGLLCVVVMLIGARILYLSESSKPLEPYKKKERILLGRGMILSSDGSVLAVSLPKYSICIDPINFDFNKIKELANALNSDHAKLEAHIKLAKSRGLRYLVLAQSVDSELASQIGALGIKGVQIQVSWRRNYPLGSLCAHVVGFVGKASTEERKRLFGDSPEAEGKFGIERAYDKYLIPKQGELRGTLVARFSHPLLTRGLGGVEPPRFGHQVVLNIDLWLQRILEEELQAALDRQNAAGAWGVILDPNSGAVLALVSLPSFDPNKPELGNHFNSVISAQTEPGSVIKPYTLSAALEKGIPLDTKIYCENGSYKVGKYEISDVHPATRYDPSGTLDLPKIVEVSSNIGICKLAQMTGEDKFYEVLSKFGFGKRTGIDLFGEMPGNLRMPNNPYWSKYDLIANSYGHGLSVTPIQLAVSFAALINGGVLYKPRLVREIRDQWGNIIVRFEPEVVAYPISESTSAIMRDVLKRVVEGEHGTGKNARVKGIGIVGKTGTAWKIENGHYIKNRHIATFVGAFPLPKPSYVIVISVDDPKGPEYQHYASYAAAPVFKKVVERMLAMADSDDLQKPTYLVASERRTGSKDGDEVSKFLSTLRTLTRLKAEQRGIRGESN